MSTLQYHGIPGALESVNDKLFDETFLACVEAESRILLHYIIMSCSSTIEQANFTGSMKSCGTSYTEVFNAVVTDREQHRSSDSYKFLVLKPIVVKPVVVTTEIVVSRKPNAAMHAHQVNAANRVAIIQAKRKAAAVAGQKAAKAAAQKTQSGT